MIASDTLKKKFLEIGNGDLHPIYWKLKGAFELPNAVTIPIYNILAKHEFHDYVGSIGPVYQLSVQMPASVIIRHIYPNKDKLFITLESTTVDEYGGTLASGTVYSDRYQAFMLNPTDLEQTINDNVSEKGNELDLANYLTIDFQLVDPALYLAMETYVSGSYPKMTSLDVLQGLLVHTLENVSATDELKQRSYTGIRGCESVTPTNNKVYDNVVITPVKIKNLYRRIQNEIGVYSGGIGCYFFKGRFFIFPPWDTTQYEKQIETMSVLALSSTDVPSTDKSFNYHAKQLFIIGTGNKLSVDDSDRYTVNQGNAYQFTPASAYDNGTYTVSQNKVTLQGKDIAQKLTVKKNERGVDVVHRAIGDYTDNPYKELSNLAFGKGKLVKVNWPSCQPDLLKPGMPLRYFYPTGDTFDYKQGTLVSATVITIPTTNAMSDNVYISTANLALFIDV